MTGWDSWLDGDGGMGRSGVCGVRESKLIRKT